MLTIPWKASTGWGTPQIHPCKHGYVYTIARRVQLTWFRVDRPFTLDPSVGVFHYAQCLFEGLKAYRDEKGKVTLFRPDMNMKRMNTSAQRIALPVRVSSQALIVSTECCADATHRLSTETR